MRVPPAVEFDAVAGATAALGLAPQLGLGSEWLKVAAVHLAPGHAPISAAINEFSKRKPPALVGRRPRGRQPPRRLGGGWHHREPPVEAPRGRVLCRWLLCGEPYNSTTACAAPTAAHATSEEEEGVEGERDGGGGHQRHYGTRGTDDVRPSELGEGARRPRQTSSE